MGTWTCGLVAIGEAVTTFDTLGNSPHDNLTEVIQLLETCGHEFGASQATIIDAIGSTVTLKESCKHKYRNAKRLVCCECRTAIDLLKMSLQNLESHGNIDKGEMEKKFLLEVLYGFEKSVLKATDELQACMVCLEEAASGIKITILDASGDKTLTRACKDAILRIYQRASGSTQSQAIERLETMTEDTCKPIAELQRVEDILKTYIQSIRQSAANIEEMASSSKYWTDTNFTDPLTRAISEVLEICENFVHKADKEN